MSTSRLALSLLVLSFLPTVSALARPLPVDDLGALVSTVEPAILLRLAERRGLDRPLGAEDRTALLDAGLSADVVDRLAAIGRPAVEVDGVAYATLDGVLTVRAEGEAKTPALEVARQEDASPTQTMGSSEPQPAGEWREPEQSFASPLHAPPDDAPRGWENPFPAGAFGSSAGAVFVPARFGNPPSAFGRVIVSTAPVVAHPWWGLAPQVTAGFALPARPGFASGELRPRPGFIPLRTSRGTLWVPN